ncbi:hypothetical protein CEP53_001363 [Fusarium sp. AF-6]|nr:hypothetical protein CEP53_001363 [Fusarium sp. AF-6]
MHEQIKLKHQVTGAYWDDHDSIWRLKILNLENEIEFDDFCHFLLDSTGILKEIQPAVKSLVHFVREPTWVVPSRLQILVQGAGGGVLDEVGLRENADFTEAQIERFKSDPEFYMKFVKAVEEVVSDNFPLTLKDTEFAASLQEKATEYMTEALGGDERLCNSIIPKFPLGCRRLTPAIDYLFVLRKANVTMGIRAISPQLSAVDELFEHTQQFTPCTAWSGNCISWFKGGTLDGPVTALHPGSRIHFFHILEGFRGEDWEYTWRTKTNRFQFLSNGFSTKELDGEDSTWYLNEPEKL